MIQAFLAGVCVLLVPGYAVLACLPERFEPPGLNRSGGFSRLADSIALSVALSAFLGLVGMLTGIHYTPLGLGVIYGACGVLILVAWIRKGLPLLRSAKPARIVRAGLYSLGGIAVLAALIFWRMYQARDLALPAWVDSVHHVLIVRKMMETGGVPWDLLPYLDVPFYYHYGFHLAAALFSSLAGWSASEGVLWFGQVINACVALAVYRLGMAFAPVGQAQEQRDARIRAGIAAVLVGLALQMPAYYLTWGRYTLLTGLLLFGPAMAAGYELWRDPQDRGAWARYGVTLVGIFLTHYLVVVLMALFLMILGVGGLWRWVRQRAWRAFPWALVVGGLLAMVLVSPWLWRLMSYNAAYAQVSVSLPQGSGSGQMASPEYLNYLVYLMGPRHNYYLLGIAAIGLLFGARRASLRLLVMWTILLALLCLPWGVRIGPFRPDLYVIVLFFPAALFLAELLLASSQAVAMMWRPAAGPVVLVLGCMLLTGWGMWETRNILNRSTVFVTRADVTALDWINQNTPQDARFFINTVAWQYNIYRGVDGGFWLTPYTGRASLVPPTIYGYGQPEMIQSITSLARRAEQITGCTVDFWRLARDANLTYVYLRVGSGKLQPEMLKTCDRLRQVYSAGGVFIYEIIFP